MTSPVRALALGLILCCLVTWTSSERTLPLPGKKPGQCPLDVDYPNCKNSPIGLKSECKTDKHCDGKKKCCYSGCTNRCLEPLEGKPGTCPYFNASICVLARPLPSQCHDDQQCQGSERCCCSNCRRACTPTVKVKPGLCPAKTTKECPVGVPSKVIKPRCQNDGNCTGTLKCCDSCGKRCVAPIKEHPGFCPVNNEQISCVTTLGDPSCSNDADCKKNEKCCLFEERMQCVPAKKEKGGCCPKPSSKCAYQPLTQRCQSDRNCDGIQKCCSSACQKKCTDPIPVKPGTCPVVNTLVACKVPYPPGDCKTDCDCLDKKKCCDTGCILRCVDV